MRYFSRSLSGESVRIGYLITKFSPITGGGEAHIELVARQISERGHDVEIITGACRERDARAFPYVVHEVQNFSDRYIDFSAVAAIVSILESGKYDILHIVNYEALLYFSFAEPCMGFDAKRVFSTYNTPLVGKRIFGGIGIYDVELREVQRALSVVDIDRFIANSEAFLDGYSDIGIPRTNTSLIHFGIDLALFTPNQEEHRKRNSEEVKVLCTSRFVARKGIEYLLGALDYLPASYHLYLTGSGSVHDQKAHNELTELARKYGDRVILASKALDLESLTRLYQSADVFVMPSQFEGFGLAALEAMACGTPVVATDVQGLKGFVRDGQTGLLVNYGSPQQIADAIERIVRDASLREPIIRNALAMAREQFNVPRMIDDYERTYRAVADLRARW